MGIRERDAPELGSAHARNAVMDSQPFVDERIVRRHQVEDASIFPHDTCAKELQLPLEGLPQVVFEVRILRRVGIHERQLA